MFAQAGGNLGEEFEVAAVIRTQADGAHVLLQGGAHDVPRRPVVAEVNDLDALADELQVDGVDGAVVPVADGDGGQEAKGGRGGTHGDKPNHLKWEVVPVF